MGSLGPKSTALRSKNGSRLLRSTTHRGPRVPCVLAIGGVDPGGGAGLAADVRAVAAAGAFASPVVATVTVQSTSGLVSQEPVRASLVLAQSNCVLEHQRVRAIKTGALGDEANVRTVARIAHAHRAIPLVVDPVRVASRAASAAARSVALVDRSGFAAIARDLVPLATIVTANTDEAAALTGIAIRRLDDARRAARAIVELGARAALVKGGHLADRAHAIDILVVGDRTITLSASRLRLAPFHGGGCLLASLIAARLALFALSARIDDAAIVAAVRWSKRRHRRALEHAIRDVGGALRVIDL
jgi:hydroxymethylpyrimidine/phosphomethylpyrimidine kinase